MISELEDIAIKSIPNEIRGKKAGEKKINRASILSGGITANSLIYV